MEGHKGRGPAVKSLYITTSVSMTACPGSLSGTGKNDLPGQLAVNRQRK